MDQESINKLLACRKLLEDHRRTRSENVLTDAEHTELVTTFMKNLASYGFNSLQEFSAWNDEVCFTTYWECRTLKGYCDKCEGYKDTPPCQLKWSADSCFLAERVSDETVIKKIVFKLYVRNETSVFKDAGSIRAFCPEGHGWYVDMSESKEFPFDVTWSVFK